MRRVESIAELNRICQKPHYRTVGNWMVRYFERDAAIYITWLLLHTPVSAHQVTLFACGVLILAGVVIGWGSQVFLFAGVMLWQFWYLLDHVDGQIARYRRTQSLEGIYFDFLMHHAATLIPPFAIGIHLRAAGGPESSVIWGFAASASLMMLALLNDAKSKTLLGYALNEPSRPTLKAKPSGTEDTRRTAATSLFKRLFSAAHKTCEGHVVMNVWTAAGILSFWLQGDSGLHYTELLAGLLKTYAVLATAVWVTKAAYLIRTGKLTSEYRNYFEEAR